MIPNNDGLKGEQMKKIIIFFLMFIALGGLFQGAIAASVEGKGEGKILSDRGSLSDRKQEAFIAAVLDALQKIGEMIYGVELNSFTKVSKPTIVEYESILAKARWKFGDFQGEGQMITENFDVKLYLISLHYKKQTIIAQDFRLISPPVGFVEFPHWGSNPRFISDVQIKTIEWFPPDKDFSYGGCTVRLLYRHEGSMIQAKKEQKSPKSLSFKFIRDQAGNLVYKKVVIDGIAFGGGKDTLDDIREKALKEALRNAVEHSNGVFIQTVTEVKNAISTRDEIISQSIGLARVLEKDFIPQFTSQGNYQVTCKLKANIPLMELVPE
jgi:hypothetical protein